MNQPREKVRRRRYRLNVKRFATVLLFIGIVTAMIVITSGALNRDEMDKLVMAPGTEVAYTTDGTIQTGPDGKDALKGRVIVLDAGHGGFDPGTTGVSGINEDVLNLAVTQHLQTEFEGNGAQVIMTRNDENALAQTKDSDMAERRRIIEQSGADMVISIHMNWYDDPKISGPLVLFMPGSEQGKRIAEAVQQSLNTALKTNGSARSKSLYILKSGNQPCILVECGYLSNGAEESKLQQTDHQKKVAKAICEGVRAFYLE